MLFKLRLLFELQNTIGVADNRMKRCEYEVNTKKVSKVATISNIF